jgi:hypothetical protein
MQMSTVKLCTDVYSYVPLLKCHQFFTLKPQKPSKAIFSDISAPFKQPDFLDPTQHHKTFVTEFSSSFNRREAFEQRYLATDSTAFSGEIFHWQGRLLF